MPPPKQQAKRVKLTSPEPEEHPVEKIAPNGDVILIVGTEKKRIQIHSDFLRLVSPNFDVMLPSQISMPHVSRELYEMELPDDDGQTMSQLLCILYGGDPEVDGLKPRNILQISILANKYIITPRISSQGIVWLQTTEMYTSEEFWCLLNASFWLGLSAQFHKISKEVVRFQTISLLQLANGTTDVLLGFRLALALEELQKYKGRGLCLYCFKTATTQFLQRGAQCPASKLHKAA